MEIWKKIDGYSGLYEVSNYGRVKSLNYNRTGKERILKPAKDKDDYLKVSLCKEGKRKMYTIHRLVAQAFIDNPNNLPEVNHKDENKQNNRVDNLEFCTSQYNIDYSLSKQVMCIETGLIYTSTMEVQRQFGFDNGNISKCCTGRYKQAYGYTWQYV